MVRPSAPLRIIDRPEEKKRKRYNKNKKKAWRKKIDLTDVDDAFDEKNMIERHGGPLEEKQNEDLFSLDFGDDYMGANNVKVNEVRPNYGLKSGNRRLKKKLECHKYLKGLPGVKPISKRKAPQPQKLQKHLSLFNKVKGGELKAALTLDIINEQSRKAQRKNKYKKKNSNLTHNFRKDLWLQDSFSKCPIKFNHKNKEAKEYLKDYLKDSVDHITNEMVRRSKRPTHGKTTSLPAVIVPTEGASYNPPREAYQQLLREAVGREVDRKLKVKRDKRLVDLHLPKDGQGITEQELLVEMAEGLPLPGDENLERKRDQRVEEEVTAPVGAKFTEKILDKDRRRLKTRKIREKKLASAKEQKIRETDVFRAKSYLKELRLDENILEDKKQKRNLKEEGEMFKPKKLSKDRFSEMDVPVQLPEDLGKPLVSAKSHGNPLDDLFQSLQKRNIIEVKINRRVSANKKKTKAINKKGAKFNAEDFGAAPKRQIR